MTQRTQPGHSFTASATRRVVTFEPDVARIRRYDPYLVKYKRASLLVLGSSLFSAAVATRLWITGHDGWSGAMTALSLALLVWAYTLWRDAIGTIYSEGLLIPAQITSLDPLQLVALADMPTSQATALYGVQRLTLAKLPGHLVQLGERVPCVAAFGGTALGGWGYFEPRPLAWATSEPDVMLAAVASIPDEEWARLDQLTRLLPMLEDDQIAFYGPDLTFIKVT